MPSQTSLLGAAGEYFVMSEMLCRGFIAALAHAGVPHADIVVTNMEGSKLCSLQVKTRRDIGSAGVWHMKEKHEDMRVETLFYCFVDFGKTPESTPTVHVVPSAVVAEVLAVSHRKWQAAPGRNSQPHKDSVMRRMLPDYTRTFGALDNPYPKGWLDPYRNAWHKLGLEPAKVEVEAE
nr:hypothetical protein [Hydrogenophaga laconesensis]